jgi:hypothetical protein
LTTVLLLPILALSEKKEYGPWCFVIAMGFSQKLITNQATKKVKQNQIVCYMSTTQTPIKANWLTYDINLDPWTKEYLGETLKIQH